MFHFPSTTPPFKYQTRKLRPSHVYPKTPAWYIMKYVYNTHSQLTPLFIDYSHSERLHANSNLVMAVLKAAITLIWCFPSRTLLAVCHLPRRCLLLLQLAELEVPLVPLSAEGDTRVEQGEADTGDDDHGALEDHKCDFIVCERSVETLVELYGAEDGAHEDGYGGDGEAWAVLGRHGRGVMVERLTDEEGLPFKGAADGYGGGVHLVWVSAQT